MKFEINPKGISQVSLDPKKLESYPECIFVAPLHMYSAARLKINHTLCMKQNKSSLRLKIIPLDWYKAFDFSDLKCSQICRHFKSLKAERMYV